MNQPHRPSSTLPSPFHSTSNPVKSTTYNGQQKTRLYRLCVLVMDSPEGG